MWQLATMVPDPFLDLAERLKAVAFPARLALLRALRTPKGIGDIRLHPVRKDGDLDPGRYVARQTIERHLKSMVELGFVVIHEGPQGRLYQASPEALFLLREELDRVSKVFAGAGPGSEQTLVQGQLAPEAPKGAHLSLVKGAYEGKHFPLTKAPDGWIIGRAVDAHVNLEYDPYVSKRHATVLRRRGKYFLRNEGRNGTTVNWTELGADEEVPLLPGAIVGVGRSMLVFTA